MRVILEEMIIRGSVRFLNKGTEELRYTPQSPIQLVLGSNGAGKSSLFDESTPLPPNRKLYVSGGYKYQRFNREGEIFEMEADFSSGAKYSFRINGGENLNAGRTYTIQKELVEQYLKFDQEAHDIIMGRINFVKMTATQRKDWISKICPYDLSLAEVIEKKASAKARQLHSAVKINKDKLTRLQADMVSEEEMTELRAALATRVKELEDLGPLINNRVQWTDTDQDSLYDTEADLASAIESVKYHSKVIDVRLSHVYLDTQTNVTSVPEEVALQLDKSKAELIETSARLSGLYDERMAIDDLKSNMGSSEVSEESLVSDIERITAELSALSCDEDLVELSNPRDVQLQIKQMTPLFENLLSRLPNNQDFKLYSREIRDGLVDTQGQLWDLVERKNARISAINHRLEHIKTTKELSCPKCTYVWLPGVDVGELPNLEEEAKQLSEEVVELKVQLQELGGKIETQNEYADMVAEFSNLTREYPRLNMIWRECHEDKRIFTSPKSLMGLCGKVVEQLNPIIRKNELEKERSHLNMILDAKRAAEGGNVKALLQREDVIERAISDLMVRHRDLKTKVDVLTSANASIDKLTELTTKIEQLVDVHAKLFIKQHEYSFAKQIQERVSNLQISIANLSERLNANNAKQNTLDTIQDMIDDLRKQAATFDTLAELLSPYDGLLAHHMNNFMEEWLGFMNGIAKPIWSHKFLIMPSPVKKGALTYKFPLLANEIGKLTDDVAEGSEGEQEMVNFLCTMAARGYRGLDGWPLYLDEAGRTFTEKHRLNLYYYIKALVESNDVGQVMVISHYPSTHNTLTNADFNYIDPTGGAVPEGANKCLILNKGTHV